MNKLNAKDKLILSCLIVICITVVYTTVKSLELRYQRIKHAEEINIHQEYIKSIDKALDKVYAIIDREDMAR